MAGLVQGAGWRRSASSQQAAQPAAHSLASAEWLKRLRADAERHAREVSSGVKRERSIDGEGEAHRLLWRQVSYPPLRVLLRLPTRAIQESSACCAQSA